MSPETDILIVGHNQERFAKDIRLAFRHWQVYTCDNPFALTGRRFARAFVTDDARAHKNYPRVLDCIEQSLVFGAELWGWEDYEEPTSPDPQDWEDAVLASDLRRSRYAQAWV